MMTFQAIRSRVLMLGAVLAMLVTNGHANDTGPDPCAGQGSATLALSGDIPPAVGTRLTVEIQGPPLAPYSLLADEGPGPVTVPRIGTLCLDLGPNLRVLRDGIRNGSPTLDGTGSATVSLPIPRAQALAGAVFYLQAIVADDNAPNGLAVSPLLTVRILPSLLEDFETTDQRDPAQTNAIWDGDGFLRGLPTSGPRTVQYTPFETNFNLSHPLVEQENPFTTGARLHMLFHPAVLGAMPGESVVGMEWSPRSDFVFVSSYQDSSMTMAHLPIRGPIPTLQLNYEQNLDRAAGAAPTTVFEGEFRVENALSQPWEPWPTFATSFEYDNERALVFEWDMPEGGDTYQLFRNNSTSVSPNNRIFGNGGSDRATFGFEDTTYWTRFILLQDRALARSNFLKPDADQPDYSPALVRLGANNPEGTSVDIEYEGALDNNGDGQPDVGTLTGFRANVDDLDGLPLIRFRLTLRPNEAEEVPVVKAVILPFDDTAEE